MKKADDLDLEKALCEASSQGSSPSECMLCLEQINALEVLRGCRHCKKEWCNVCDLRWRITQTSASLIPTCPFCRKRLEALSTEQSNYAARLRGTVHEDELFDKFLISMLKWISYLVLALVLLLLPFLEAYLTQEDNNNEAFVAYVFLILFVFVFLACHYRRVGRSTEDEEDGSHLTV